MIFYILKKKQLIKFFKFLLMIFFSTFGSLFAFLYVFIGGKLLSPFDFGVLNSTNSLFAIFTIPVSILQISAVKTFLSFKNKLGNNLINIFKKFFFEVCYLSIFILLIFIVFDKFFFNFSKFDDRYLSIIIYLNILLIFLIAPFNIYLLANKKYYFYSIFSSVQSFLRLFFFILLITSITKSYYAGLFGNILSLLLVFIFFLFYFKINYKLNFSTQNFSKKFIIFKNINISSLLIFYIVLSSSFDSVIFIKLFPDETAGYYSGISVIAKIPLFFCSLAFNYIYAETIDNNLKKKNNNTIINVVSIFFVTSIFLILGTYYFFGELIIKTIFNYDYSIYHKEFFILSIGYSVLAITQAMLFFLIGFNFLNLIFFLFSSLIISLIFLYNFSENIKDYSTNIMYIFVFQFVVLILYLLILKIIKNLKTKISLKNY